MPRLSSRPLLDTRADVQLFINRQDELKELKRISRANFNALLIGTRGVGKTSLLRRLQFDLRAQKKNPVFVDGGLADDAEGLLELLRFSLFGTRQRPKSMLPEYLPPEGDSQGPEKLLRAVRNLEMRLTDGPTRIVLLDSPDPRPAHTLFGRLRDELWRLPLSWVVTADEERRWQYLTPPADAFFEHVLDLKPLSQSASKALLESRTAPKMLRVHDKQSIIQLSKGNPRQLITLARAATAGKLTGPPMEQARARLQAKLASLGRPAAMLVAELEALGPVSASDRRLLQRLGWTRPRAVQVLKELEREGIVRSTIEQPEGSGRPRTIYHLDTKVYG